MTNGINGPKISARAKKRPTLSRGRSGADAARDMSAARSLSQAPNSSLRPEIEMLRRPRIEPITRRSHRPGHAKAGDRPPLRAHLRESRGATHPRRTQTHPTVGPRRPLPLRQPDACKQSVRIEAMVAKNRQAHGREQASRISPAARHSTSRWYRPATSRATEAEARFFNVPPATPTAASRSPPSRHRISARLITSPPLFIYRPGLA